MYRKLKKVKGYDEPEKLICIGIDPSLVGTGIAVVESPGEIAFLHGWTNKKSIQKRHPERLSYFDILKDKKSSQEALRLFRIELITDWVLHQVSYWAAQGTEVYVAIEGYALSAHSNRASDLHELCGLIKLGIWEKEIPLRVYSPTSIKKAWTGNGAADKSMMIMTAFRRFDVDCTAYEHAGENLADAALIAFMLYHEVALKRGDITLKDCGKHLRESFLKITKSEPEALITRPFIKQSESLPKPILGYC